MSELPISQREGEQPQVEPFKFGSEHQNVYTRQRRLHELFDATDMLLAYVCRNAVTPAGMEEADFRKLTQDLLSGRDLLLKSPHDSQAEAAFLENFRKLSIG